MAPIYGVRNQVDDDIIYWQGVDLVRTKIEVLVVIENKYLKSGDNSEGTLRQAHD